MGKVDGLFGPLALDTLTVPASSTPVERDSTMGKQKRLAKGNLEREVLL